MTLTSDQVVRLEAWGVVALAQVDDHPFAWWAMRDDTHVVVKAGDPGERHREALALRAFGVGSTDVIEHDWDLGLLVTRRRGHAGNRPPGCGPASRAGNRVRAAAASGHRCGLRRAA